MESSDFYLRYYVGHKGRFGHEFLEFEVRGDGRLRYANNSNYKSDTLIRKELYMSQLVVKQFEAIVFDSGILTCEDTLWPKADEGGRQELELVIGDKTSRITTFKIGSMLDITNSSDPDGLKTFYYLIQDLKCFLFSLITLHFRVKPV